jgi:Holliday junction resolvase RusA-like endonuclease
VTPGHHGDCLPLPLCRVQTNEFESMGFLFIRNDRHVVLLNHVPGDLDLGPFRERARTKNPSRLLISVIPGQGIDLLQSISLRLMSQQQEYRLLMPGRPVSFRSRHAGAYKQSIRGIAERVLPKDPPKGMVSVHIDYFHATKRRFDMDNVAKTIMDALSGIAYFDDVVVSKQGSRAYYLGDPVFLLGEPLDLVKPLQQYEEYTVVRLIYLPSTRPGRGRKR